MSKDKFVSHPTVGDIPAFLVGAQLGAVAFLPDGLLLHCESAPTQRIGWYLGSSGRGDG